MSPTEDRKAEKVTNTIDGGIVSDRRLYLSRARAGVAGAESGQRVVEEGDPDAAYLLVSAGDTIPADQVQALGLEIVGGKVKQSASAARGARATVAGVIVNHDQETGPALKRAAEEARNADLRSGRMQTEVAVTEPPPGDEEAVAARESAAKSPAAKQPAAKRSAAKKRGE